MIPVSWRIIRDFLSKQKSYLSQTVLEYVFKGVYYNVVMYWKIKKKHSGMESNFHLLEMFGTVPKLNLTER